MYLTMYMYLLERDETENEQNQQPKRDCYKLIGNNVDRFVKGNQFCDNFCRVLFLKGKKKREKTQGVQSSLICTQGRVVQMTKFFFSSTFVLEQGLSKSYKCHQNPHSKDEKWKLVPNRFSHPITRFLTLQQTIYYGGDSCQSISGEE